MSEQKALGGCKKPPLLTVRRGMELWTEGCVNTFFMRNNMWGADFVMDNVILN
jgi:hypothetical protein